MDKLLKLIKEVNKFAKNKINSQILDFFYTNNNQLENIIKSEGLFTMSKVIK